jgi:hypothetical protein
VANAILRAAEHPVRDITIGGGGRLLAAVGTALPRLTDFYMERSMFTSQRSDTPAKTLEPLYADSAFTWESAAGGGTGPGCVCRNPLSHELGRRLIATTES